MSLSYATSLQVANHYVEGKLAMPLPPYIDIENDTERRRAVVRVKDAEVREQREMWGTCDGIQ